MQQKWRCGVNNILTTYEINMNFFFYQLYMVKAKMFAFGMGGAV